MKHYTKLIELETQVYHLRENFALFDSVMGAHMNEFDKSQTPLGLSLWRLVELMRTNTEEIKDQFYDLFDEIREESHEEESKASQADKQITPWDHTVNSIQKATSQEGSINLNGFGARESLMINQLEEPNTFSFGTDQLTILTEKDIQNLMLKPL
jgi:hypothetical protein